MKIMAKMAAPPLGIIRYISACKTVQDTVQLSRMLPHCL
jgi:hypothetical protein